MRNKHESRKVAKKIIIIVSVYVIGIIIISLIFSTNESVTAKISVKRPTIHLDSENNVHIGWIETIKNFPTGSYSTSLHYTKQDSTGNALIKDTVITSDCSYPLIFGPWIKTDIKNNIHIFWLDEGKHNVFYKKLNKQGKTIVETMKIINNDPIQHHFTTPPISFSFAIDSSDNVHMLWEDPKNYTWYSEENGENYYPLVDEKKGIFYARLDSYGSKITDDMWLNISFGSLRIDSQNNRYVFSRNRVYKYNSEWNLLNATNKTNLPSISNLGRLYTDDDGETTYIGIGVMDDDNNIHICHGVHSVYNTVAQNKIYYTKYDSNGSTLINSRTIIESGGYYSIPLVYNTDDRNELHILWTDLREDSNPDDNIAEWNLYYMKLNDSGIKVMSDRRVNDLRISMPFVVILSLLTMAGILPLIGRILTRKSFSEISLNAKNCGILLASGTYYFVLGTVFIFKSSWMFAVIGLLLGFVLSILLIKFKSDEEKAEKNIMLTALVIYTIIAMLLWILIPRWGIIFE